MRTLVDIYAEEEKHQAILTWWENYPVIVDGEIKYPKITFISAEEPKVIATLKTSWTIKQKREVREITDEQINRLKKKGEWTEIKTESGQKMLFPPNLWKNDK